MKRLLWTTLLSLFCLTAQSFKVNDLYYEMYSYFDFDDLTIKTAVEVDFCTDTLTHLNIPAQVEYEGVTYKVLKIAGDAFRFRKFKTITFAEGLEEIGYEAFLQSTIGDGISQKVVFPKSLKKIGRRAFRQSNNFMFDEASLGPDVSLGEECFHQSKWHNDKLAGTEELIYAGKTLYGAKPTVTTISQVREGTTSIANAAFKQHPNLQSVTLPGTIKTISDEAFQDCPKLQSVLIGEGTLGIGQSTFNGCSALTNLTLPNSIEEIEWWAFLNCTELGEITLPSQLESIDGEAFQNCTKLNIVGEWPNNLSYMGRSVFENCTSLSSASLSDNLKIISSGDFMGCSSLTTVKLPARLRIIGESAFADCPKLEPFLFPDSIAEINADAFLNCTKFDVDEKNIVDSVLLGTNCFKNTVWYNQQPGNLLYLGSRLVALKTDDGGNPFPLTDVEIKPGTTRIYPKVFYGQDQLTQVTIPDAVEKIGESAFMLCTAINQVKLPAHLKELQTAVFAGCQSLKKLELPKDLEYIGTGAMYYTSIASLTIPKSVTRVDSLALGGMPFLKELVIEDSKSMGGYPFYVDYGLTQMVTEPPTSTAPSVANLMIDQELKQVAIKVFKKGTATLNSTIPPDYTSLFGDNYSLTITVDMPPIVVPDGWTSPAAGTYQDRTVIYARMGNDERCPQYGDIISAFVNGECRGSYTFTGNNSIGLNQRALPYELVPLQVWSTQEEVDAGTAITFKYSRGGLVYDVVSTNTADIQANFHTYGKPDTPVLFSLPNAVTNLTLRLADPDQQVLEVMVDESVDLDRVLEKVLEPKDATLPPGSYWDAGNSRNFTITGSTLTGINPSPDGNETIYLHYQGVNAASGKVEDMVATFNQLRITPKVIPVTGIEAIAPTTPSTDVLVNMPITVEFRVQPFNATNLDVELYSPSYNLDLGTVTQKEVPNEFSVVVTPRALGTHNMTIKTVDGNHSLPLQFNAKTRYESAAFDTPTDTYEVGTKYRLPRITVTPAEPVFDPAHITKVDVVVAGNTQPEYSGTFAPQLCEVGQDADGWYFIPKVICQNAKLEVEISGMLSTVTQDVNFDKVYTKDKGWSWVSVPYTYDFLNGQNDRSLVEVRSSDKMVYNDATYGWYGQMFKMHPGQAYKQNAVYPTNYKIAYQPQIFDLSKVTLHKGWNWVGVPREYDYSMEMIFKDGVLTPVVGDMILSKSAVYLCDGKMWESSVQGDRLTLRSGEGYLYLSTMDNTAINWGEPYAGPIYAQHKRPLQAQQMTNSDSHQHQWNYDASKFSSAMAVVGEMTTALERENEMYAIGAFVGNECRGEGRILDNGLLLISVNGEPGEEVHFVLHDAVTDEVRAFENRLNFSRLAGSMQAPVRFQLEDEATGIGTVEGTELNVRFEGDKVCVDGGYAFTIYTTGGKAVSNEHLTTGVYIVVVMTEDGPVTVKAVKK